MSYPHHPESANSHTIGVILCVIITIILALLILLSFSLPNITMNFSPVPEIFKITKIRHINEDGQLNFDSYMVVMNTGSEAYMNRNLYARTYRNCIELDCAIPTMNGHDFIDGSHHFGVQNLAGMGAKGSMWYPGAKIWIDYKDATFHPGDRIRLDVYDSLTQKIISRHEFLA